MVEILNSALLINGKSSLSNGSQVGISIAVMFIWAAQNVLRIDKQGWINNIAAIFQICSVIIIVIILFALSPQKASAKDVFTSTYNGTGFSMPYVCCIGIITTASSLSGYEGM